MSNSPTFQQSLGAGTRLGRFELITTLARGGMATVWIARVVEGLGADSLCAVKTILPQYADDPLFQSMLIDEARISSQVQHPNVAAVFEAGDAGGILFLAMELVVGESWSKLHNAAARMGELVPMPITLRIAADICAGLHAAHELRAPDGTPLQVVHRDVSPQNVLISVDGTAKLIDFGVAKAVDRMQNETTAGTVKGKVFFCAPEQAFGRPVDRRADVWAVGAVLYKMLTGRLPFEAENELAMLHMLMSGASPHPLPSNIPASVQAIVTRALQRDPNRRYSTTLHMQQALEAAIWEPTDSHDVAACMQKFLGSTLMARQTQLANMTSAMREGASPSSLAGFDMPRSMAHTGSYGNYTPTPSAPSGNSVSVLTPSALNTMQIGDSALPPAAPNSQRRLPWLPIAAGAALVLGVLLIGAYALGTSSARSTANASQPHQADNVAQPTAAANTASAIATTATASVSASATAASTTPAASAAETAAPSASAAATAAPKPKVPTVVSPKKSKPDDGF